MSLPRAARVRRHHRSAGRTDPIRSVRTQLLAPIVVATLGLMVLGATQTATAMSASDDANRARVLAGTATATVRLVHELEREFGETAALRQRGGTSGRPLVVAQQRRVDAAVDRYRDTSRDGRRAAPDLAPVLDTVDDHLGQLEQARRAAPTTPAADSTYVTLVESLLTVADALPAQLRDTDLANSAREVAAVAAQEHLAALERDLVRAVFIRGALLPGELARLGELRGGREQRRAEFSRIADARSRDAWARRITGPDVAAAQRMRDGLLQADGRPEALRVDGDAWYVAQSGTIRRYNLLGRELSEDLDRQAASLARDARRRAVVIAGATTAVAVATLLAAVVLAVYTSRRLRRLRVAALTMANSELPERITAIAAGENTATEGAATRMTAGIRQGRDEIAQVAEAFDTVNRAALKLAGEQAELRLDVTRMAEALARRIRTLITRQLRLLDEFEREETDPEALARLFALDHLAARMRRNGENLLVLAGGEPGRANEGDHLLADVVRAAASEIEDYQRIEIDVPVAAVRGSAVGYLVHLLAELLENATNYSPPHTTVQVDGLRTVDGLLLRVHDQGIGISESRLAEINQGLLVPSTLTSEAAGRMGLHVVAHLAARHGIRVQLHDGRQGTVAHIEVPEGALARVEAVTGRSGPLRERFGAAAWFRTDSRIRTPSGAGVTGAGHGPTMVLPTIIAQPAAGRPSAAPVTTAAAPAVPARPAAPVTTAAGLPRRSRGGAMQSGLHQAPAPPAADDLLDPEVVRARLSALAEGVASAMRRNQQTRPTGSQP